MAVKLSAAVLNWEQMKAAAPVELVTLGPSNWANSFAEQVMAAMELKKERSVGVWERNLKK